MIFRAVILDRSLFEAGKKTMVSWSVRTVLMGCLFCSTLPGCGESVVLKRNVSMQVLAMIPIVGNFIALIDALMIFRASRKCLHDDIAGTKVIVYQPR